MSSRSPVRALARLTQPFLSFLRTTAASGGLLLLATAAALAWANGPFSASYRAMLAWPLSVGAGAHAARFTLHALVDDGLMSLFFLLVGLEIKRELVKGELATARQALLPAVAALGGMVAPALIYVALNLGHGTASGWGTPTATDIAFSLSCARLAGGRIPPSVVVLLTALAIFDELGAIVVIALFYGDGVTLAALAPVAAALLALALLNRQNIHNPYVYLVVGAGLWWALHRAGIHPSLAGVALGAAIPAHAARPGDVVLSDVAAEIAGLDAGTEGSRDAAVQAIEKHLEAAQAPLDRIEHELTPWVAYVVVPAFALTNAGVELGALSLADLASPVTLGVALGLLVGKPLGVMTATWAAVRAGLSPMPRGATWGHLLAVSSLAGIGFTMSLFIGQLAFSAPADLNRAKAGILIGSLASAVAGVAIALAQPRRPDGSTG